LDSRFLEQCRSGGESADRRHQTGRFFLLAVLLSFKLRFCILAASQSFRGWSFSFGFLVNSPNIRSTLKGPCSKSKDPCLIRVLRLGTAFCLCLVKCHMQGPGPQNGCTCGLNKRLPQTSKEGNFTETGSLSGTGSCLCLARCHIQNRRRYI
jgi:hypothetical protein